MNKITEATLSLSPKVRLINPEVVRSYFEDVGRFSALCYADNREEIGSYSPSKLRAIGKNCFQSGHMSGARNQYMIFEISGGSRTFTHQLVRHSQGVDFNQRSQRYVEESIPAFYLPQSIANNNAASKIYIEFMYEAWNTAKALKDLGIPGEDYREVYPNATLSDINVAISMQALQHMCYERLCSRASFQIRSAVKQMRDLVVELEPELNSGLQAKCKILRYCPEVHGCGLTKTLKELSEATK